MRVAPTDEARRAVPAGEPWWAEWFGLWFGTVDGPAGYSVIVLLPGQGRALYLAAFLMPDEPLVSVVDLAQGVPRDGLRLRNGNLWVDHVCEEPLRQWTVMNETYGVALDDPDEALGRAYGTPTPVAFDLEWYAVADAQPAAPDGYRIEGRVHGVVERPGGEVTLDDLPGRLEHRWGRWPFPADPGPMPVGRRAPALLLGPDGPLGRQAVIGPDGWWCGPVAEAQAASER